MESKHATVQRHLKIVVTLLSESDFRKWQHANPRGNPLVKKINPIVSIGSSKVVSLWSVPIREAVPCSLYVHNTFKVTALLRDHSITAQAIAVSTPNSVFHGNAAKWKNKISK